MSLRFCADVVVFVLIKIIRRTVHNLRFSAHRNIL